MAFKKYAKRVVRRVARKVYGAAKKRYVKKGMPNVKNIYKDVAMLKHLVNVEKKRFDVTLSNTVGVAQVAGAGVSGAYATIITPFPLEGVTQSTRIGNSLKITSACIDLQFTQQASTVNRLKCRWYIVCRPDNGFNYTASTSLTQFLEVNPFSTVNDYFSSRDPEYFTAMKVIKQGQVTLHTDSVTSSRSNMQVKIPLKLNHHLKFNTDATNITTKNQFYLFVTASDGDVLTNTGAALLYNCRWYFTDN